MGKVKAEARQDRKKGVKVSKVKNKGKGRRRERAFHALPDLAAVGAVATPFIYPLPNGDSVLESFMAKDAYGGYGGAAQHAVGVIVNNAGYYAKPVVVLTVLSFALKWLGKKTGLNRLGTKEVKVA